MTRHLNLPVSAPLAAGGVSVVSAACGVVGATAPEVEKSARLSECGTYRYTLTRHWGPGEALMFVMLNPSTADANVDDPTIRRCMGFARRDGFDGIVVQNLYALRSPDPKVLYGIGFAHDPIGPENDDYLAMTLTERVRRGLPVVAAWGAGITSPKRDRIRFNARMRAVRQLVPGVDWRCLGVTGAGAPRHPLYVRGAQPLIPFSEGGDRRARVGVEVTPTRSQ